MDIKDILAIVVVCILTIAYVAIALLSYLRGKKAKVDPAEVNEVFAHIASNVIDLVYSAEGAYSSVTKGGALKLKDVLNDIKEQCEEGGVAFDKGYWTDFIKRAVDLINLNRKTEEKPVETHVDKATTGA